MIIPKGLVFIVCVAGIFGLIALGNWLGERAWKRGDEFRHG